jgi:hypothetical protein
MQEQLSFLLQRSLPPVRLSYVRIVSSQQTKNSLIHNDTRYTSYSFIITNVIPAVLTDSHKAIFNPSAVIAVNIVNKHLIFFQITP